jgi:KipI family sensor histidine kinase inhibitor
MNIFPSGDKGILIKFGDHIDERLNLIIKNYVEKIKEENFPWIEEIVPSFTDVMVLYSCEHIRYFEAKRILMSYFEVEERMSKIETRIVNIPVLYGEDYGIDIIDVASMNGLSVRDVINIHTESRYLVYMLGFTPGFPYLGGLDERLHTPRLKTPRKVIQAGSVAIRGEQRGVYPIDSPGGWRIIGRTPLKLFDMDREPPALLRQGDYIQFFEINAVEFEEIEKQLQEGCYELEVEELRI